MSYNQPDNERAAFAPDGYAPLFWGEHQNQQDNMFVDTLRPAGTAPTVLRGDQMSTENEIFVEANHILTGDPVWVAGVMDAPMMGDLPVISQPVARVPGYDVQDGGYHAASNQTAQRWDGMQGYGRGYNDGYRAGAAQAAYGHYPGAGQVGYDYSNSTNTHPMAHGSTNIATQGAGNTTWNAYLGALDAPAMANLAANPQLQRRSHSPVKQQALAYRRRSPQDLDPTAPSFAPPFVPAPPAHLSYPPLSTQPSYPTVQSHNFTSYHGAATRNGAWTFSGGDHAATPYQVRRNEAQMLVGQQRRFSPGSDDVRNHISSESSAASNDEDEHESDADEASEDEAEEDDVDGEHESEENDSSNDEEDEAEAHTPRKRHGKFHAGNKRLVCDNCHAKHYKCIKPDPNKPCAGCMKARGGPIECKVTRRPGT
ncbi:hypothetical protein KCU95_g2823, partial [Aureobasidium melanogenum]